MVPASGEPVSPRELRESLQPDIRTVAADATCHTTCPVLPVLILKVVPSTSCYSSTICIELVYTREGLPETNCSCKNFQSQPSLSLRIRRFQSASCSPRIRNIKDTSLSHISTVLCNLGTLQSMSYSSKTSITKVICFNTTCTHRTGKIFTDLRPRLWYQNSEYVRFFPWEQAAALALQPLDCL